jgi:hypothetical protein
MAKKSETKKFEGGIEPPAGEGFDGGIRPPEVRGWRRAAQVRGRHRPAAQEAAGPAGVGGRWDGGSDDVAARHEGQLLLTGLDRAQAQWADRVNA